MISNFVGTLEIAGVNKGVLITTSNFDENLEQVFKNINKNIIPIDGNKLVDLMIEHNIGVKTENFYEIKKVDSDFFTNEV
jgi:restriction system protein